MREYETWEAFKMLGENPKLKFETIKTKYENMVLFVDDCGYYVLHEKGNESKHIEPCGNLNQNDKWQLVRQPVTWQEALQARIDGKTIICKNCGGCNDGSKCMLAESRTFFQSKKVMDVCTNQLKTGTWYIEDDADE
jgi:hypothetical protein